MFGGAMSQSKPPDKPAIPPDARECYEVNIVDSVAVVIDRSDKPDDVWLWCIFCERFFQAKYLRIDYQGNRQGCAFCGCAGFDCAIFKWDTFSEGDPDLPRSESELRHGLRLIQNDMT